LTPEGSQRPSGCDPFRVGRLAGFRQSPDALRDPGLMAVIPAGCSGTFIVSADETLSGRRLRFRLPIVAFRSAKVARLSRSERRHTRGAERRQPQRPTAGRRARFVRFRVSSRLRAENLSERPAPPTNRRSVPGERRGREVSSDSRIGSQHRIAPPLTSYAPPITWSQPTSLHLLSPALSRRTGVPGIGFRLLSPELSWNSSAAGPGHPIF